jgi:hypothetical protein
MVFLGLALAGLVAYFVLAPAVPRRQSVHVVLGDAAPRVGEIRLRYAPETEATRKNHDAIVEDWTREAAFRFSDGGAPRIVTHEPELADGDYVVEIEILTASQGHSTARGRASLAGSPAQLDVSQAVPQ